MEEKKYPCVFNSLETCPVRQTFKLQPESLVGFCKICKSTRANINQEKLIKTEYYKDVLLRLGLKEPFEIDSAIEDIVKEALIKMEEKRKPTI